MMKPQKYKLTIELLSDLCASDGGSYNSLIDTDVCHDEYGFPYIPAKRIKGCLRECAMELNDWGKSIDINGLFGSPGAEINGSKIQMGNAYIVGYEEKKDEVKENQRSPLYHPQLVLQQYTSLRSQTAISQETGVADPHSLRTIRVINKGLVFQSEVVFPAEYYEDLSMCCNVFTGMGVSRTRGFGEIRAELKPMEPEENEANNQTNNQANNQTNNQVNNQTNNLAKDQTNDQTNNYTNDQTQNGSELERSLPSTADFIEYEITLEEPVMCKSVAGGESRTQDYIEGSKVLGAILGELKREGRQKDIDALLQDSSLIFSNAYIGTDETDTSASVCESDKAEAEDHCKGGVKTRRYTEVPAYMYSIKNSESDYVNRIKSNGAPPVGIQLNQMEHCYVLEENGQLMRLDVRMEERYHHRRPDDKSVGRALTSDADSNFYQMASISAGQKFYGFIRGGSEQIALIHDCLTQKDHWRFGYSRNSEYGTSKMRIVSTSKYEASLCKGKDFLVKLDAPTLIYNENAMVSLSREDLIDEIIFSLNQSCGEKPIKAEDINGYKSNTNDKPNTNDERNANDEPNTNDRLKSYDNIETFINYTTLGGYNTTWNLHKPTLPAFDKGTVVYLKFNQDITLPKALFIGERRLEGYGEASVSVLKGSGSLHSESLHSESPSSEISRSKNSSSESSHDNSEKSLAPNNDGNFEAAIRSFRSGTLIVRDRTSKVRDTTPSKDAESVPKKYKLRLPKESLGSQLAGQLYRSYLTSKAIEAARGVADDASKIGRKLEDYRPTISNLLTSFDDFKSMQAVKQMVQERYENKSQDKKNKSEYANHMIKVAEEAFGETREDFLSGLNIEQWDYAANGEVSEADYFQLLLLKEMLISLKYLIRSKEGKKEERKDG